MYLPEMTREETRQAVRRAAARMEHGERLAKAECYLLDQIEYYVEQAVIAAIRERQRSIANLRVLNHGYKAVWGGELTPGCQNCLEGSGLGAIRSVSQCNLHCDFCYYYGEEDPRLLPDHFICGNLLFTTDDIKMLLDRQRTSLGGVSWVFWEPFMDIQKHYTLIAYIARMGLHQHMYTNGTLCTEHDFKLLGDAGLNELRFNLAATNCSRTVLKNMAAARKYFEYLCIESPMTESFYASFVANRREILDTGVDHINCAELHIKEKHSRYMNEPLYRYKYSYTSPVASRQLTYDLLTMASREDWPNIVINDCSNELKYYRSFHPSAPFGRSAWKRSDWRLPFAWYEAALNRYVIFDEICKAAEETRPLGIQTS